MSDEIKMTDGKQTKSTGERTLEKAIDSVRPENFVQVKSKDTIEVKDVND